MTTIRARTLTRLAALLAALTLLAAACADGETDLDDTVDDLEQAIEDIVEEVEEQIDGDESAPDEPGDPDDPPEDPGPGEEPVEDQDAGAPAEDESELEVPDDRATLGTACRAYLRGDIPRLVVEVAHQAGAAPQGDAVQHLVATLREVVDKPAGVDLAGPREVPGGARTWTADDLRAHAAEHRTAYSSGYEMAMFVLSVRGDFEREGVLGVAISATEFVLFPDNIGDLTTSLLGGRTPIERAVLVHEAGHLLCLVNISYTSDIDHEDPDNPHHSVHRDSVMHWAIPNDAITQVFTGPPPDRFHPDDLADLEGLRTGRH